MKKFGQFCFCAVPIALVFVIENLVIFFFMGIAALVSAIYYRPAGGIGFYDIYSDIFDMMLTTSFNMYTMVMYALVAIAFYGLWYYIKYNADYLPKLKTVFHPLSICGLVLLVPGAQYLTSYLVTLIATIFPSWLEAYEELLEASGMDSTLTFELVLYSVILAPIAEELICRGVTLSQAKKVMPFWLANILQATLFGLLHMNLLQGTYAFCLGVLLGYLFEKSGSIYPPIIFHLLFNFWGTVLSEHMPYPETMFSAILFFLFSLLASVGGMALFITGSKKARGNCTI